jgi:pyruvate/2-oxoglutarate/acetoin dehydrogenase E1 component
MKKSYIESLRSGLLDLLEDKNVLLIGEDIEEPYGGAFKVSKELSIKYPDQVINMPMSEQGFTGMAVGMALAGMKPIVEIMFGDFITLIIDQLVNHASKFSWMYEKKMHIVVRTPMGGYRGYGATHSQSLEKLLFGLPEIHVVASSIVDEPGRLLKTSVSFGKPVLFVENKLDYSSKLLSALDTRYIINKDDLFFPNYTVYYDEEESDITLITYGGLVQKAVDIQKELYMDEEIGVKLIIPTLLSPFKFKHLFDAVKEDDNIIIIEEGHTPFGWGDGVLSQLIQMGLTCNIRTIGAKNVVIGAAKNLEESTLPDFSEIKKVIIDLVG